MYAHRFLPTSLSLLASGLVAAFAGTAHAGQSCALDSDCGHGFACQVVAESACPNIACAPGQPCPTLPPCEATQIKECVPGPCTAHSDCADGMVCIASVPVTTCPTSTAPACPPNQKCGAPAPQPSECTTVTTQTCTPRYELPCANEASCGTGFNCVPDPDSCNCGTATAGSSGASAPPSAGFAPPSSGVGGSPSSGPTPPNTNTPAPAPSGATPLPDPAPPQGCTCTPSTTKHCEPKTVSCNADTDCPATWTCVTVGGSASSGCAGAARILPDGGVQVIAPVCDPAPPPPMTIKQCQPPYYGGGPKGIGIPEVGGGTTGSNTGSTTGTQDPLPGSGPVDPRVPSGQPPSTGAPGTDVTNHSTDSSGAMAQDNGSCQMTLGHASTTGASLIGLLGIAGLARRRRTRWG